MTAKSVLYRLEVCLLSLPAGALPVSVGWQRFQASGSKWQLSFCNTTSVIKSGFRYICILLLLKSVLRIFRLTSKNTNFSYNFDSGFADWSKQEGLKDLQNNKVTILSKTKAEKAINLCQSKIKMRSYFPLTVVSTFPKYWETSKKYFKITFVKQW